MCIFAKLNLGRDYTLINYKLLKFIHNENKIVNS